MSRCLAIVRVRCPQVRPLPVCTLPLQPPPPNPAGEASPRGHKRSRSDAKPAKTQSRLCFAPLQPPKPCKRQAKKGDADHQGWCASAFDVIENAIDKDGRPTRIRVQCLLCQRRNVTKEYTVLSKGRKDKVDHKSRPSVSCPAPNDM